MRPPRPSSTPSAAKSSTRHRKRQAAHSAPEAFNPWPATPGCKHAATCVATFGFIHIVSTFDGEGK